jgi:alpha-ketoglutarate-dependent taurine dioxygenase
MEMQDKLVNNQTLDCWSLDQDQPYQAWREAKLTVANTSGHLPAIRLKDLAIPTESERSELAKRCQFANLALYETDVSGQDIEKSRADLRSFADALGLEIAERHRSAGEHGIVALRVTDAERQRGYIPYSRRPMNWHTDGYYNGPDNQIRAMVLHCVTPANDGGMNQFLDPEIAYIRLRDRDPNHIRALMNAKAMTIPENREADGSVRPASIGPVFSVGEDGKLAMRYTARTRSISWRDDAMTSRAVAALTDILNSDDPLIMTARLKPGQGILCNNVLHNRTGFDPDTKQQSDRLVFRIRFHNRVKGS